MSDDDEHIPRWRLVVWLTIIVVGIPALCFGAAGYHYGLKIGIEQGVAEEKARREVVNAQLRAAGLCQWPAAFYKAANCGGEP